MVVGLVTTAVVALVGCVLLRVLGKRYIATAGPSIAADDAQIRPGLVHFVMTSCKPGTAAYGSTILDLAARGYLGVSNHPTGLWLTYNEVAAGYTPLAGYEQRVLAPCTGG